MKLLQLFPREMKQIDSKLPSDWFDTVSVVMYRSGRRDIALFEIRVINNLLTFPNYIFKQRHNPSTQCQLSKRLGHLLVGQSERPERTATEMINI